MKYPIGIQNFEKLREGGFVYIDKTEKIHELASQGVYYFLSRPRRFGKSLLISTMEAYFSGKKELFKGLAMERLESEWKEYPVLHLDLSGVTYSTEEDYVQKIDKTLRDWEERYGIKNTYTVESVRFSVIIQAAYQATGKPVVILIDEYDKPIIDNLDNPELQEHLRVRLQGFYGVLKEKDGIIRFGFLTGVTKIGKLSVFSTLNNLTDISMDWRYADICGISESDLHSYFGEGVAELAKANDMNEEECYAKLAEMYDGYHFSRISEGMYNPFSLLNTLQKQEFNEYWFETGTPTFLVKLLKQNEYDISKLSENEVEIDFDFMSGVSDWKEDPIPMLYQSGYLTIKSADVKFRVYSLGFPNNEVKNGFMKLMLSNYAPIQGKEGNALVARLYKAVVSGRPDEMMKILEGLFARANYQIQGDAERDFQYAMYIIFELLGEYVRTEYQTSSGRIDIMLQAKNNIYVIEIKTDGSADEALAQIEAKGYAKSFADDSRPVHKIGVNFSTASRRITEWKTTL